MSGFLCKLPLPLIVGSLLGPAPGAALQLIDEQINIIDYEIEDGWLSVYNSSATYIVDGGYVSSASLYQHTWLDMNGGSIAYRLTAYTVSEVYLSGGSVGSLRAKTVATIDWSGGSVGGDVVSDDAAAIRIYGSGFTVDFAAVPYGVLDAPEGTLRGTLNDGTAIEVPFYHAGALWMGAAVTGTIELISGDPVQSPAPDYSIYTVLLNDGSIFNVDDDAFDNLPLNVRLRSPGARTTLNVLPGAEIGYGVGASENSLLSISGGDIGYRQAFYCCTILSVGDQVELLVSGGVIHGSTIIDQQAVAEISGGTFAQEVWLDGDAQLLLTGGFLDGGLVLYGDSHLEMEGGFVSGDFEVSATAVIRGGEIRDGLIVGFEGEVEIVGSDFKIWGDPVGLGEVAERDGQLTGVLENGDPLDVDFRRYQYESGTQEGKITLVPEPDKVVMLVAVLACLFAVRGCATRSSSARG